MSEPLLPAVSPGMSSSDGGGDVVLRGVGLHKRYRLGKDNYVHALRGATVDIWTGEIVAIMGPSGSGKSTLMHILGCLDTPDEGEVRLSGRRVDDASGAELTSIRRHEVGFIFQGFNLVPTLTAQENVALAAEYAGIGRGEAAARAAEVLGRIGLGDRLRHLPSELSGGQQQRVAIARALVNDPTVVLGDEPTGDLDSVTSREIMAMLREINGTTGTTFVLVTHDSDVGDACDRVVHMLDGVVREHDAVEGAEEDGEG